jgi:hypothetical protein
MGKRPTGKGRLELAKQFEKEFKNLIVATDDLTITI